MSPFAIRLRSRLRSDQWGAITLSAREPGRVQLTFFDDEGPYGHTCRDTVADALVEATDWQGLEVECVEPADHHEAVAAVTADAARRAELQAMVDRMMGEV